MNVASLDLCRELYRLSKWGENLKKEHLEIWGVDSEKRAAVITSSEYASGDDKIGIPITLIPAYDLGYLLRKLQKENFETELTVLPSYSSVRIRQGMTTSGASADPMDGVETEADTPEDAACKLAIELWKQGVLK